MEEKTEKKIAILFVHGIIGGFVEVAGLPEAAADYGHVDLQVLPGHGGPFADFLRSDIDAWLRSVDERLAALSKAYDEVILFGHSLGALLALYAAYKNPFNVKRIMLWACPFKISAPTVSARLLRSQIKRRETGAPVLDKSKPSTKWPTPWQAVRSIKRLLPIVTFSRRVEIVYPSLPFEITAFQVEHDELINPDKSERKLLENPNALVHRLSESSHAYLVSPEYEQVESTLKTILERALQDDQGGETFFKPFGVSS